MPTYELVPLPNATFIGPKAGDVVAYRFGFFCVAIDFAPYRNDASGVNKAVFYGACSLDVQGSLFNASVFFNGRAVRGLDRGERTLDGLQQVALIGFDLLKVFAAFFYDEAGGLLLVV